MTKSAWKTPFPSTARNKRGNLCRRKIAASTASEFCTSLVLVDLFSAMWYNEKWLGVSAHKMNFVKQSIIDKCKLTT